MVLVDTSVWIDFLTDRRNSSVEALVSLIENEESIAFTPVILQELMQGCADKASADAIEAHFQPLLEIFPQRTTYKLAARIYRECRKQGYTIRSSVDCLIAACAMEHDCAVLHQDRDYTHIAKGCGLKVMKEWKI